MIAGCTRRGEHLDDPVPDAATVDQDEQGHEQREQGAGEDVAADRCQVEALLDEGARVIADRGDQALEVGLDVGLGEVQRRREQEVLELLVLRERLPLEVGEPAAHLDDDDGDQPRDHGDDGELVDRDGEPLRPALALQPGRERNEQCGEQQGDEERDGDEPQLHDEEADEPDHGGDHENAPRPRRGDAHRGGHEVVGVHRSRRLGRRLCAVGTLARRGALGGIVGSGHPLSLGIGAGMLGGRPRRCPGRPLGSKACRRRSQRRAPDA
jgi:hypothetical protein